MNTKVAILFLLVGTSTALNDQCRTCVIVEKCPSLSKIFKQRPYSSQSLNFYKTVACGLEGFTPKVCCDTNLISDLIQDHKNHILQTSYNEEKLINKLLTNDNPDSIAALSTVGAVKIFKQNYIGNPDQTLINEECGIKKHGKIIGGITAAIGLFPWMAKLGYIGSKTMLRQSDDEAQDIGYRCGGSLITRKHVLTAAHCIVGLPRKMRLHVIVLDADGTPQRRRPALLMSHPEFNSPLAHHDLGIIKLNRQARFTEKVMPICLPVTAMAINPSQLLPRSLMVAGWGSTEAGSKILSPRLRYTRLTYLNDVECQRLFMKHFNLTLGGGHICTVPDRERDACAGDSGAPLFTWSGDGSGPSAVILGVVSFGGKECAAKDVPAVFTKIDAYIDWIIETLNM